MAIFLFLISIILFFTFLISLIKPTLILKNGTRLKSFLFFLLPSIVVIVIATKLNTSNIQNNWENPEGVENLRLTSKKLENLPEKLKEFKDLKSLNISKNNLQTLDKEILTSLPNLKKINLSDNPISELPEWLADLNLEKLNLNGTNIKEIPSDITNKIKKISFDNTPLAKIQKEQENQEEQKHTEKQGETFSQFAIRKMLGKEYGYSKNFKKGELYYTKSVTNEEVDSLGNYLLQQGYFNDEKTISMQITYNDKKDIQAYELRAIYSGTDEPVKNVQDLFTIQAIFISNKVFAGKAFHFHLTDNEFKSLYVYKSND